MNLSTVWGNILVKDTDVTLRLQVPVPGFSSKFPETACPIGDIGVHLAKASLD